MITGSVEKSARGATLSASFSGVTADNAAQNIGFKYRKQGDAEYSTVYVNDTFVGSGSYSAEVTGLIPYSTYLYKAVMDVKDPATGNYVTIEGDELTFTTDSEGAVSNLGYLVCYEVPEVSLSGTGSDGYYYDKDDYWYSYNTTNSMRAVATHTFKSGSKYIRNFTVMLDGEKKAPLWTAHAMHASMWAYNNVGRKESWKYDPAFDPDWQQSGISGSYSKGHMVASNYRQTTEDQNKQTFYYSNQAPQWQTTFNDGVWNQLENKVVASVPSGRDTLYIVSGLLYEGTANYVSGIQIPSHFYKCVMLCSFNSSGEMVNAKGCAYVFTNEAHKNEHFSDSKFKASIKEIEDRTGINFFPRVPASLQSTAENSKTPIWSESN